jgi:hypothetical protein
MHAWSGQAKRTIESSPEANMNQHSLWLTQALRTLGFGWPGMAGPAQANLHRPIKRALQGR